MKIFITGSNGLLGQKLLEALEHRKDTVLATSRGENRATPGPYSYQSLDITDKKNVLKTLAAFKPDAVLHTAAMTLVDPSEQNHEVCWAINVEGTRNLVEAAEKTGSHFIHLSTDFIFDGQKGPYREEDSANPVNYYGKSKLAAEGIVRQSKLRWSILRTILVFGVVKNKSRSNIVLRVQESLEKGSAMRVVTDQVRMPTLAEDLASACLAVVDKKASGIFHICGEEQMSIYDFACRTAKAFNLDSNLIRPVTSAELNEPAKRPPRTGFILDKARREIGYRPTPLDIGLEIVRDQIKKTSRNY